MLSDPISSCPLSLAVKVADGKTNSYVDSAHLVGWTPGHQSCVMMTAYLWSPSEPNIFYLHSPQDRN